MNYECGNVMLIYILLQISGLQGEWIVNTLIL